MTPENFCYWLQGFFELRKESTELNAEQTVQIKEHLKTVFNKVTPPIQTVQGAGGLVQQPQLHHQDFQRFVQPGQPFQFPPGQVIC